MTFADAEYTRLPSLAVYDILTGEPPIDLIMVRTNDPFGGDMLYGYCKWDGEQLISLDGDDYGLYDEITKHEWSDTGPVKLTYWIHSDWIVEEET